jgi:hypothetical protein
MCKRGRRCRKNVNGSSIGVVSPRPLQSCILAPWHFLASQNQRNHQINAFDSFLAFLIVPFLKAT